MTARTQRPSANQTRESILAAAKALFLEHGFDGTQIKDIAKTAKVNTNLIFHHFTNKETLWNTVRDQCMGSNIPQPNYDLSNGRAFFKSILDYRFHIYNDNPEFTKLIKWGSLASQEQDLVSQECYSPTHWLPLIKELQENNDINKKIPPKQIMLFIIFSSHAPFWQDVIPFGKKDTEAYKIMLIDMCCQQFLTHSLSKQTA